MKQQRFLEIDLIKIISCLAVMAIHVSARGISDPTITGTARNVSQFINGISFFAVPSFIFLSGLALMLRYGGQTVSYSAFIKKRMNSIVLPYLFWGFTYFLIYTFGGYYNFDLNNILSVIFLGTGEYHLYFVVILFQLYLLFPALKAVLERIGTPMGLFLLLSVHVAYTAFAPSFPYMDRVFVPYLIFFCAGMFWGRHYTIMNLWIQTHVRFIVFLYLCFAVLYIDARFRPESFVAFIPQLWQLFSLASILMLMTFGTAAEKAIPVQAGTKRIQTMSAATFYVYLAHPLVIAFFNKICDDVGFHDLSLVMPLCYVVTTLVSFWCALEYLKYKEHKKQNRAESN